jgi:hypothetical protein
MNTAGMKLSRGEQNTVIEMMNEYMVFARKL